jgi:8-oxo-dGTP pyrophosphatase MutT (NUDIX family)
MSQTKKVSQASVVPYRFIESKLEFCLITTRTSQRWGFPKGWIHDHETVEHAALTEAKEEAGLTGEIVGEPLGRYSYRKAGSKRNVIVMLMAVLDCDEEWKESHQRERRWVSAAEAQTILLERPDLAQMLSEALHVLQPNIDTAGDVA